MKSDNIAAQRVDRVWLREQACDLSEFARLVDRTTSLADYPNAAGIEKNVVIYDSAAIISKSASEQGALEVLAEICDVFATGPGVAVFKHACTDMAVLDRANALFSEIIEEQHRNNTGSGDHFAKPGANDRIWNTLEKHGLRDPENFVQYYANPIIMLASRAWLGPNYQMTAQVNRVNPGGAAQSAHRDYHLGFQKASVIEQYPAHVHHLSPVLTLQGGVAHCDMPLESGPTLFLPYSQTYAHGYLAMNRPEFQSHFTEHHVQLPLKKGDMVFFNPALIHAAGTNRSTDILRMANLLQVSSAFGRAMETVNREKLSGVIYPALLKAVTDGSLNRSQADCVIAASAEGYSFPTNLDRDPPLGGMAPKTQAQLMAEALDMKMEPTAFLAALAAQAEKKQS